MLLLALKIQVFILSDYLYKYHIYIYIYIYIEEYSGGNPSETEIVHVAPGDLPQTYTQFTKANRDMIRQREREAAVINLDANTLNIPSTNGATQINIVSSGLREGQITQYMPDPMDLDGDGEGEGLEIGGLKKITRA